MRLGLGTDLVVVRERGEGLVEADALKLLIVGIDAEHLELRGRDAHKGLQVLLERRQRDPLVHVDQETCRASIATETLHLADACLSKAT